MEEKLLKEAYEKSKDYLYEDSSRYNLLSIIEKAQKEFKNFVKLHNEEIERIKKGNVKTLKCMGF